MSKYTREDILQIVEEEGVEFIRLQFTDLSGQLKNVAITASQLERVLENQCSFNGAAIDHFVCIEESDMYLCPDLDTFMIVPWRPQQGKVARFMCNICRKDQIPFEGDCRHVLKKVLKKAESMGYILKVGPEMEFFVYPTDDYGNINTDTKDLAGYFDLAPLDRGENVRRDIVMNLEDMDIEVESSYHEHAPNQHEIDLAYAEALKIADSIQTFRLTAKTLAKRHGLHATFMPKPKNGKAGSGMHLNVSLNDKFGKNLFGDSSDVNGLSHLAYLFLGGIMNHLEGMALVTNPLINSYKRLQPGFDAPMYIAWSKSNRSTAIRIPTARPQNARLELRSPDSVANPYLALALILEAGLEGIEKEIMPPVSVDKNIFAMNENELEHHHICTYPSSLGEAIIAFEKDELVRQTLGDFITDKYVKSKKEEWQRYQEYVTDWELQEYLRKF